MAAADSDVGRAVFVATELGAAAAAAVATAAAAAAAAAQQVQPGAAADAPVVDDTWGAGLQPCAEAPATDSIVGRALLVATELAAAAAASQQVLPGSASDMPAAARQVQPDAADMLHI